MNIVFFGTSAFGLPSLEALKKSSHKLLSVITTLDKPQGRTLKLKASPVKGWAQKNDFPYLEVSKKSITQLPSMLQDLGADLFIVISFGLILPKELLEVPKLMALNLHASLLPRYRGPAPIHWALINGDAETGVTVMRMVEKLDAGDILLQKKTALLPNDDITSLEKRLSLLGAEALLEAKPIFTPQDESLASYARKLTKEDGHIVWDRPAVEIINRLRALKSWPKSYSFYEGKRILVIEAEITREENKGHYPTGSLVTASQEQGIQVAAADRLVAIKRLQLEGKKPLEAAEFLKGFLLKSGQILE